jgi:undecaprenyl diphosphate synthase
MTVSSASDLCDSKAFFSAEDLALLDPRKIPKHVAIIMDGNRRWARQNNLLPMIGHWEGAAVLTQIVKSAAELGIKTITVFAFSTENWARPHPEIDALMKIFELYLVREKENMIRDSVRLDAIGKLSQLPPQVQLALEETKAATKHCDKINLVLALNYGGRDEIRRALAKILEMKIAPEELTEELIGKQLDTSPWGDPELLIRTSGELRVSNFLLWQISYAEIYVTNVLWPDFSPQELFAAVLAFQRRGRRLGGGVI